MTTISKEIDKGDILIHRDGDEAFYVRWTENYLDGQGYVPKDLSNWTAEFQLYVDRTMVFSTPCLCDPYGYVIAQIKANTLSGIEWQTRDNGSWQIIGHGPEGETEILTWGYYRIV